MELTDDWWLEQTGTLTADDARTALMDMLWCFQEDCEVTAIGTISMIAGVTLPDRWLSCDGQSVLRSAWPKLFAAIGTIWGSVDGTHFNLPNLRDRSPIGWNAGGTNQGQYAGAFTHAITVGELPAHSHVQQIGNNVTMKAFVAGGSGVATPQGIATSSANNMVTQNSGGGGLLSLLHPVAPLLFIIYAGE